MRCFYVITKKLYNGNINPSEKLIKHDSKFEKLSKKPVETERIVTRDFADEQKALYTTMDDISSELDFIIREEAFSEGFRIGALMVFELFHPSESQFENTQE